LIRAREHSGGFVVRAQVEVSIASKAVCC
jgi:hypothetical protein